MQRNIILTDRLDSISFIKGIAICMVIFVHSVQRINGITSFISIPAKYGQIVYSCRNVPSFRKKTKVRTEGTRKPDYSSIKEKMTGITEDKLKKYIKFARKIKMQKETDD